MTEIEKTKEWVENKIRENLDNFIGEPITDGCLSAIAANTLYLIKSFSLYEKQSIKSRKIYIYQSSIYIDNISVTLMNPYYLDVKSGSCVYIINIDTETIEKVKPL